jgi:cellulose synthase/poly-beta-1,6-N-acetylglucosamine synthase-like glycosyltransferase
MEVVKITGWVLFYLVNAILAFHFLLPGIFFILHCFIKKHNTITELLHTDDETISYAAIITAHKDTRFIPPLVDSFIKQSYKNFILYVVADACDITGLDYDDNRIFILKPEPSLNSKIKSINYALDNFVTPHQVMVIFDSDNLVHPDYLKKLNCYFKRGFKVVQTHMLSKNTDSTFARLDSLGHVFYTFIERQAKMELGLTSAILGLGIALDTELYKEISYNNVIGGFDKKLQSQLAIKVKQIAFAEDAIVYDEKVADGAALEKQRTRWIYSYFEHFKDSWNLFAAGIKTRSMGRLLLGATMLRPPMFLLISGAFLMMIIALLVKPVICIIWIAILVIFSISFLLIVATQSKQKGIVGSMIYIPLVIFRQVKSLLKIKAAKSDFLKTEHTKIIYIDEILNNEPA